MADTQHNLRIKATLDASQLQQELDRLNTAGTRGGATGSASSNGVLQSTARMLSKLDTTLSKLNHAIEGLMRQQFNRGFSAPGGISQAIGQDMLQSLNNARNGVRSPRPSGYQYDTAQASPALPVSFSPDVERRIKVGAVAHYAGSTMKDFAQFADQGSYARGVLELAGNTITGAGMGYSVAGPYGAVAGAALEFIKTTYKQLEEESKNVEQNLRGAYVTHSQIFDRRNLQRVQNADMTTQIGRNTVDFYIDLYKDAQKRRESEIANQMENVRLLSEAYIADPDSDTMKQLQRNKEILQTMDQRAQAEKTVLEAMKKLKEEYEKRVHDAQAEHEAGQQLARAEIVFAARLRSEEEEAEMRDQLIREEQWLDNERRLDEGAKTTRRIQESMDYEQARQQISLGMWKGGTAADQFTGAMYLRERMKSLVREAETTDSADRLDEIHEELAVLQTQFSYAMSLGQLLKDLGSPLQKLQLGSLTSLANRGVNMGERTEMQRPYDKKMDEMVDLLQNIEENTRAAEKAIWE